MDSASKALQASEKARVALYVLFQSNAFHDTSESQLNITKEKPPALTEKIAKCWREKKNTKVPLKQEAKDADWDTTLSSKSEGVWFPLKTRIWILKVDQQLAGGENTLPLNLWSTSESISKAPQRQWTHQVAVFT